MSPSSTPPRRSSRGRITSATTERAIRAASRADAIPLPGRIAAVADAFDAITTDRPHRAARPVAIAAVILRAERGLQFDRPCSTRCSARSTARHGSSSASRRPCRGDPLTSTSRSQVAARTLGASRSQLRRWSDEGRIAAVARAVDTAASGSRTCAPRRAAGRAPPPAADRTRPTGRCRGREVLRTSARRSRARRRRRSTPRSRTAGSRPSTHGPRCAGAGTRCARLRAAATSTRDRGHARRCCARRARTARPCSNGTRSSSASARC